MEILIVVNDVAGIHPDQTTALFLHEIARRGWRVHVASVSGLMMMPDDRILAVAAEVSVGTDAAQTVAFAARAPRTTVDLTAIDATWIRTNPARDVASATMHETALQLLSIVVDRGGLVLNDPIGLMRASSKLYLQAVPPAFRPRTLVSRDAESLRAFVHEAPGRCVLKPLKGTRGEDVFFVDPADARNLSQIIDVLTRQGVAMAQDFVPEATRGDTRLLLLDGEPLQVDGQIAAVRRAPGIGELRSNVAQGGTAMPADDLAATLAVGRAVGERLRADGLWLVGLDIIGGKAVEVNVYSPGGLLDANRFGGVDFVEVVVDALAARARQHAHR